MRLPPAAAVDRLTRDHDLDAPRGREPAAVPRAIRWPRRARVPDAATIVIERVRDELGDWRVCVLSPRGGRIHAPWAMAAAAKIREETGIDVETLWGDDGFVVRFPDVDQPPDPRLLLPDPDEVQALVVRQLGATALFAAKFRENAARSLLLPKRRPGMRAPLWQQRKRAADLLAVASRYGSFPVLLETYRECLRDFFDMPALVATLADVRSRKIRVATVDSEKPSPFAASLLFSYVASFLYDGDAPLAERRAQALAVDQAQLRELIGDAELRELLDAESMDAIERQLQRLDPQYRARSADGVHDMLLAHRRSHRATSCSAARAERRHRRKHRRARRRAPRRCRADRRRAAVHRRRGCRPLSRRPGRAAAARHSGIAARSRSAIRSAISRCATRAPTRRSPPPTSPPGTGSARRRGSRADAAGRRGRGCSRASSAPAAREREWTDAGVLRMLRRRSLAKLRHEVEPVDQAVLGRFVTTWQGVVEAAAGRRCAARRRRAAAGRAARRVDSRDRDPAGADRGVRSGGSRRGHGGRRSRLGRRRTARRT